MKIQVVIWELDNYRGRTGRRYLIMQRMPSGNGLIHVTPSKTYTLDEAITTCRSNDWDVLTTGDFYQVV